MMLSLVFPHDDIFKAVKQEASLYSIRRSDKEGNTLFESLVFDEAYLPKFRELFFNAQAQLMPLLSTYQSSVIRSPNIAERNDFSKNRDFIVYLDMPVSFPADMAHAIEDHIFNFIKDWIMYKWYETKDVDAASIFLSNCIGPDGNGGLKNNLKLALMHRRLPLRRHHGYY